MRPSSPTGPQGRPSIHRDSKSPSRRAQSTDRCDESDFSSDDDSDKPANENLSDREEQYVCTTYSVHVSNKKAQTQRHKIEKKIERTTLESAPLPTDNCRRNSSWNVVALVFVVLSAVLVGCKVNSNSPELKINCTEFEKLEKVFPMQDPDLWKTLKIGIEGVLNGKPAKPSVFLILHQNSKATKKLTSDIFDVATKCFGPNFNAVTLSSDDFASEDVLRDQGIAIERYRMALETGGVFLIADLNKIPAKAAQALHAICDNENPIVHKAVIFLTLASSTDIGPPVQRAEDTLKMLWGAELQENILDPLITRVTDQVLELVPE